MDLRFFARKTTTERECVERPPRFRNPDRPSRNIWSRSGIRRFHVLLLLHLAAAAGVFWSVCAAFGTLAED
jgi:hypothetical protein